MKTLKQFLLLYILFTVSFLGTGYSYKLKKELEPPYYVVTALEGGIWKKQSVASNVVYAKCKFHNIKMVQNQLNSYFKAFFSKSRGNKGIDNVIAFNYDAIDQAELKRREIIGRFIVWSPLLLTNFSVLSED